MSPERSGPRIGSAATQPVPLRLQVRHVVSEYSVGPLKQADSPLLVEFREVISVDGRPVQSLRQARHALSLDMMSADDHVRKRMLEEFAKHGLVDIATDYGLILLAFTKRGLEHMEIMAGGEQRIGAEEAWVLSWKQTSTTGAELEFHGKLANRRPLQGTLWVRKPDGLPLRIQAWAEAVEFNRRVRDEASIEYTLSSHGFLTPASVAHRHLVDGRLITENLYRYEPFRQFGADTDIKFTEVPDPANLPPARK